MITVVENTDSSLLLSAQGFDKEDGVIRLYDAQDYCSLNLSSDLLAC